MEREGGRVGRREGGRQAGGEGGRKERRTSAAWCITG